jgi:hypothetical protein
MAPPSQVWVSIKRNACQYPLAGGRQSVILNYSWDYIVFEGNKEIHLERVE